MSLCTVCNGVPHDVRIHGKVCRNGHPEAIVGRYKTGRCKGCHRAVVRAYYARNRDRERQRHREWLARVKGLRRASNVPLSVGLSVPPELPD